MLMPKQLIKSHHKNFANFFWLSVHISIMQYSRYKVAVFASIGNNMEKLCVFIPLFLTTAT